jgi:hypothetical protein
MKTSSKHGEPDETVLPLMEMDSRLGKISTDQIGLWFRLAGTGAVRWESIHRSTPKVHFRVNHFRVQFCLD